MSAGEVERLVSELSGGTGGDEEEEWLYGGRPELPSFSLSRVLSGFLPTRKLPASRAPHAAACGLPCGASSACLRPSARQRSPPPPPPRPAHAPNAQRPSGCGAGPGRGRGVGTQPRLLRARRSRPLATLSLFLVSILELCWRVSVVL